ncbi:hypothetical protein DRP04_13745 [Archaeoglobales archaeon]|nr:MAG: hypothetical protein DRP04_13745 [Archaeoglobales archaeon]
MECEICGKKAEAVCPRCYRYICRECSDPITLECIDCSSIKRVLEEDLLRYVEKLKKKLEYMEKVFSKCFECPLYKDSIMSCMRKTKELESLAKLESYERVFDEVADLKERAKNLAVNYLVRLKMS